ncbi:5-hydroxytryptamine receptor 3B-like [Megalobrama amblycephala]|uniref:5-hydroxytryptamine receptor 3B-like n=1 Tax=Megalobrama amblycephala TaxID=75352 RepID=UPI0020144668|nr:5-hydroxytryptamine receptor 3B-like [Megalobrama amblycephala]
MEMPQGGLDQQLLGELRAATAFALRVTKVTAQSVGHAMSTLVVQQRHLWLTSSAFSATRWRASPNSSPPHKSRLRLLNTSCPSGPLPPPRRQSNSQHPPNSRVPLADTVPSPPQPSQVVCGRGTLDYENLSQEGAPVSVRGSALPLAAPSHIASRCQCDGAGRALCAVSHPHCYLAESGHTLGRFHAVRVGSLHSASLPHPRIEADFGTKESPNVLLYYTGFTLSAELLTLTTACKMDLYKFPLDTQNCNITLQSTSYSNQEIELLTFTKLDDLTTFKSKQLFQSDGEWELISIDSIDSVGNGSIESIKMAQLIYQITIKRRPLLYVINIIVPVFFFLVLDVMSFFIDTSGENKVGFKVTLLLSISVMLLLVNNILPSTSKQIPLIGVYCCAIFCLITISMVETIFVNFIMVKGAEKGSVETTAAVTGQDDGVRDPEYPPDSVRDQNEEQSNTINLQNQILADVQATTQRKQRQKLSWTTVARIIDVIFLVLYIITIIVLMCVLCKLWYP